MIANKENKNNHNGQPLCALVIFDGFGMAMPSKGNAISEAKMPVFDKLWEESPHTLLYASGRAVGLPAGLMGNSEVGHLNLGAGRVVIQELSKINEAIESKTFFQNPVLLSAIKRASAEGSNLHLMGLLSDGGIHSDFKHAFALLKMIKDSDFKKEVYIHIFTDGRDVAPQSAGRYINALENEIEEIGLGKIATVVGRAYAMDRAHNWKRIKQVYEMICQGKGRKVKNTLEALRRDYKKGLNDQFIEPSVVYKNGEPVCEVNDRDVIIFFNLRSERARQLSKPFVLKEFDQFKREVIVDDIFFVGMTNFGDDLPMSVAFPEFPIPKTLPEILSSYNLKQLYLAEEEKYAHVTYFFHGGTTIDFPGEKKIMVDSMDVKDYATCPEMSSREVLDVFLKHIKEGKDNFILVNFPNPDMLAHTGDLKAAIKTMECLDGCLEKMVDAVHEQHGTMLITADHGGIEEMLDPETGEAVTKHSTNPVPFIIVNDVKEKTLVDGVLADVAPTILDIMGIPKPEEMTGKSLIIKEKKQK